MKDFFTSRFQTIKDYLATQDIPGTDWLDIFTWQYWIEPNLASNSRYAAFGIALVIAICAVLLTWRRQLKENHKQSPVYHFELQQIANLVTFIIVTTVSYLFFRTQQLAYGSSRVFILICVLTSLVWIILIFIHLKRVTARRRLSYLEKERFFRYLPKKRK